VVTSTSFTEAANKVLADNGNIAEIKDLSNDVFIHARLVGEAN
jgi:hypothetical protein